MTDWTAAELSIVWLSLKVAGVAMLATVVPAVGVAWLLARGRFWGRAALNVLVHLPLVVPPVVTGYLLLRLTGIPILEGWVVASLFLYAVAGLFWLPVVWMQLRMRDLAVRAVEAGTDLPQAYYRLFRWWFAFGFPGFGSVLAIVWLMIAQPPL